jgi:hypothetical protein
LTQQHACLKAITVFGLLADHIQHVVDQLAAVGIVPTGPVVAGSRLSVNEIVWPEEGTVGAVADLNANRIF